MAGDLRDRRKQTDQMFDGHRKTEAFAALRKTSAHVAMPMSSSPRPLSEGRAIELPETYAHLGRSKPLAQLLDATDTVALLVLQDAKVRYENYWRTGGRRVPWISFSVAKSFVSAMVGIAEAEGLIGGLDDPITDYVDALRGSGYDGASIRQVLQMSSGVRFREDYTDTSTEIFGLSAALGPGGSLDRFMRTLVRETAPGTLCQYSSADTQALGMLLRRVTGFSLADYMAEKLCEPLGMEDPSYWLVDSEGTEVAFAGILMTARDFARFGELYRNGGAVDGRQIVPPAYVEQSVRISAAHLRPGEPRVGGHRFPLGYGYQWWIPAGDRGEFSAIGIYNQYVFVDPSRHAVIVKLSANPAYGTSHHDEDNKDEENIFALRAIAASLKDDDHGS